MSANRSNGFRILPGQAEDPTLSRISFAAFIIAGCLLAFAPIRSDFYPQVIHVTLDTLHFPAAALLYLFLVRHVPAASATRRIVIALALSGMTILSVEMIQSLIAGRHTASSDMFMGAGGVLSAAALGLIPVESASRRTFLGCSGIAIISIILLAPTAWDWAQVLRVNVQPNTIATFEWRGAGRAWEPQWGSNSHSPALRVVHQTWPRATNVLEVSIRKGGWSGVSTAVTSYTAKPAGISFVVDNPLSPFELFVQVAWVDRNGAEEREEWSVLVHKGIQTVVHRSGLPDRSHAARRIRRILFYGKEAAGSRYFYLDDIKALMK